MDMDVEMNLSMNMNMKIKMKMKMKMEIEMETAKVFQKLQKEKTMFTKHDISPDQDMFPQLLNAREVSQILRLSPSTVYQLLQRGDIPSVHFGRSVRVRPKDLEAFVESKLANTGNQ